MHNAMRKLQVWNQVLVICLNTPPQPTWGHSMHFYDQAPRPPLNQITQQVCQSTGLELRIPNIYLYFVKVAQLNSEDPPHNSPTPPGPLQNRLIYIPIDSSRRQNSKYVIYISIGTHKVMILEPSCYSGEYFFTACVFFLSS